MGKFGNITQVLQLSPQLFDAYGTPYVGISERGFIDQTLLNYVTPEFMASWLAGNLAEGVDYGSGSHRLGMWEKLWALFQQVKAGTVGIGPGSHVDPPVGTPVAFLTYDFAQAARQAEYGINYQGELALEEDEVQRRKEILAFNGTPGDFADFDGPTVRFLFLTNLASNLTPVMGATSPSAAFRTAEGVPLNGAQFLKLQQLANQHGPSGNGETGAPGGND